MLHRQPADSMLQTFSLAKQVHVHCIVYIYVGLQGVPEPLLWDLWMYQNDTWTLWGVFSARSSFQNAFKPIIRHELPGVHWQALLSGTLSACTDCESSQVKLRQQLQINLQADSSKLVCIMRPNTECPTTRNSGMYLISKTGVLSRCIPQ